MAIQKAPTWVRSKKGSVRIRIRIRTHCMESLKPGKTLFSIHTYSYPRATRHTLSLILIPLLSCSQLIIFTYTWMLDVSFWVPKKKRSRLCKRRQVKTFCQTKFWLFSHQGRVNIHGVPGPHFCIQLITT